MIYNSSNAFTPLQGEIFIFYLQEAKSNLKVLIFLLMLEMIDET